MANSILRLPEVKDKTKKSRSSIYADMAKDKFPKQIKLGARSSGWLESEIDDWINERIADRDSEVA